MKKTLLTFTVISLVAGTSIAREKNAKEKEVTGNIIISRDDAQNLKNALKDSDFSIKKGKKADCPKTCYFVEVQKETSMKPVIGPVTKSKNNISLEPLA